MPGLYEQYTDKSLFSLMRNTSSTSFDYIEMKAEVDRRLAERDLKAASAQVWSAWLQLAAVVAMFLTAFATAAVHCIGRIRPAARNFALWIALLWIFLVGLSRLVIGVHWPTDVLAAVCIGAFLPLAMSLALELRHA